MSLNEDKLSTWLGNLYTMETDLQQLFSSQLDVLTQNSDLKSKLQNYVDNGHGRLEKIQKSLEKLNQDVSKIKTTVAKILGSVKATVDGMKTDEILHTLASDLGLLQHSISYYRVTQLMSQNLEKKEITKTIEENMREHLQLAESINQSFTNVVKSVFEDKQNSKSK